MVAIISRNQEGLGMALVEGKVKASLKLGDNTYPL